MTKLDLKDDLYFECRKYFTCLMIYKKEVCQKLYTNYSKCITNLELKNKNSRL
jgi:hypothetical protein